MFVQNRFVKNHGSKKDHLTQWIAFPNKVYEIAKSIDNSNNGIYTNENIMRLPVRNIIIIMCYQRGVGCWWPLPPYGHEVFPIFLIGSCQTSLVFHYCRLEPLQCLHLASSHPLCQTLIKGKIRCGEWSEYKLYL